jgi:hypothetical protein
MMDGQVRSGRACGGAAEVTLHHLSAYPVLVAYGRAVGEVLVARRDTAARRPPYPEGPMTPNTVGYSEEMPFAGLPDGRLDPAPTGFRREAEGFKPSR